MPFLIFQSLGPAELIIILAIVVVLFGASRIGDIGGSIGRGIREFRREVKEGEKETGTEEERDKATADASKEKKA
jgi:sec-independent protein translocase protein TatA